MRQLLLAFPVIITLLVSGCTLPGGICIPGLTCDQTVEETHDVIVIESLQALPDNVIPDGSVKLVAIVTNNADINAEITNIPNVRVELYDYCSGLFDITGNSGGTPITSDGFSQTNSLAAMEISLLRGEKKQLEWDLKAKPRSQVPVKTECNLKVLARYPYATKSLTTLHFINYDEMQRRINEGTYQEVGSYVSVGYGPIKPYVMVEGTQPIPVENNNINAVLSIQVKNRGEGFLTTEDGNTPPEGYTIKKDSIVISAQQQDETARNLANALKTCKDKNIPEEGLKLIKGESTKIVCPISGISGGYIPVETTKTIQASIGTDETGNFDPESDDVYWYEFRKEIKVTVEPKF